MAHKIKGGQGTENRPELHFISTGPTFPYPYYLAVMSALKTQNVSATNIWLTTPVTGRFFDLIKHKVNVIKVEAPVFRALKGESEHVRNAHIKDYLAWKILYERGGLYMDLDVLCMKDAANLLDGKKVHIFPDNPEQTIINISVVGAQPKTDLMKALLDDAIYKLNNQDSIEWTEIGAKLLMEHIKERPGDVAIGGYGLAGHCVGAGVKGVFGESDSLYNPDARVAHLFASASGHLFDEVDENYIESRSTIYARLVRQVLTKEEWDTRPWELVKDIGGEEKFIFEPDVNGYPMFLLRNEPYLSVSCRYNHVWEKITTDFVKSNLKEGQTFIDVGASIGYYTVLASKLVGSSGHVIAFEPCSLVFPLLKANLMLNNCTNVRLIEKAATAGKGTAKLFSWGKDSNYIQYSLTNESKVFEEVETTSLDEEISLSEPPQMIKIDVDGGESLVIDGMNRLLQESVPIFIIIEDYSKKTVSRLSSDYGVMLMGEEKPADNYLMLKPAKKESVPYKIRSSFLSAPWYEKVIADTLDMYKRGEDLSSSPMTKIGRIASWKGKWHYTCNHPKSIEELEANLRKREASLIDTYESIKKNGYNGSIIAAWFDKDGQVHLYDGFHRIAVMKYLGIETEVNVETIWSCKDYDFPLADTLETLPRVGKCTYLPVSDSRVKDFPVDRKDSQERLDYILKNLVGQTVLDIGCSEGYFSIELAKRGYKVTAVDSDPGKVAVTRYLSILNNVDVECICGEGERILEDGRKYDNILYLSVFHNTIYTFGVAKAFMLLRKLRNAANRLFFEVPNGDSEAQWVERSKGPPLYYFNGKDFEKIITDALNMKVIELRKMFRPMYLLTGGGVKNTPIFKPISDEKWEKDNQWEKAWWRMCINTYGEQVLQDMYARYMKLYDLAKPGYSFDLGGMSVLDVGGGPVSLLLRCTNFKRAVVLDPCDYPNWVAERYKLAGIEWVKVPAEDFMPEEKFDECWIYNVLQHVRDPAKVVECAKKHAHKIRVFESLEVGVHQGHPHNLSKEALDEVFERKGLVNERGGNPGEIDYYGVFRYD